MSSNTSPLQYDHLEDPFNADVDFKVNISQKMTVPHKISFTDSSNNTNWMPNNEPALDMKVPSRILVAGQNQHIGTKAPPREIDYDNSILSRESYNKDDVRVSTPPRSLTLDKYPFPDFNDVPEKEVQVEKPVYNMDVYSDNFNLTTDSLQHIDHDNEISASQEISHLRREMAKMNRRIMALESENLQRLQKEKILYGFGIAYFVLKAIVWLNRSSY